MLVKFLHSHKIPLDRWKSVGPRGEILVGLLIYLLVHLFVCLLALLGLACLTWGVSLPDAFWLYL